MLRGVGHKCFRPGLALSAVLALGCACATLGCASVALGQAITIDSKTGAPRTDAPIDKRYQQITPTKVDLPAEPMGASGHQALIRSLMAEHGFAMRPLPRGKKGLTLEANGKLTPAGENYVMMVTDQGLSAKPGEQLIITDLRIERNRIVLDLNGGPVPKHEFLRHISIGMDPTMTVPIVQDPGQEPTGARITLNFDGGRVPNVTAEQVKALLAPLISFGVQSPLQAFTSTLPFQLRDAIAAHQVWVGMTTDMVLFAKGQPESKTREVAGQLPFEEWIYGHPPQDVTFVRINGNRVIRVAVAKVGQPLVVYDRNVVDGLMTTDGRPVVAANTHEQHTVRMGDVHPDVETQEPAPPPSLRKPGETLPQDGSKDTVDNTREGAMKPVQFPKQKPDGQAGGQTRGQDGARPEYQPSTEQKAPAAPAAPATPPAATPGATPPATPPPAEHLLAQPELPTGN